MPLTDDEKRERECLELCDVHCDLGGLQEFLDEHWLTIETAMFTRRSKLTQERRSAFLAGQAESVAHYDWLLKLLAKAFEDFHRKCSSVRPVAPIRES